MLVLSGKNLAGLLPPLQIIAAVELRAQVADEVVAAKAAPSALERKHIAYDARRSRVVQVSK